MVIFLDLKLLKIIIISKNIPTKWSAMTLELDHYPCLLLSCHPSSKWSKSREESHGNTLSKTTSSGMTNDGVLMHTRTDQDIGLQTVMNPYIPHKL